MLSYDEFSKTLLIEDGERLDGTAVIRIGSTELNHFWDIKKEYAYLIEFVKHKFYKEYVALMEEKGD